jgi:hypothetical protein
MSRDSIENVEQDSIASIPDEITKCSTTRTNLLYWGPCQEMSPDGTFSAGGSPLKHVFNRNMLS